MVDCVGWHGEGGAWGKVVREDGSGGGDYARETERGGAVDAERFRNHAVEAGWGSVGVQWGVNGGSVGEFWTRWLVGGDILWEIFDGVVTWDYHVAGVGFVQLFL